jgi:N-acetylglucosamine kinase-like BadF-type ATPase
VSSGSSAVLGLDIGGSSSRARLSEGGRVLAEAEGMGANVAELAPRTVERRLTALLAELGSVHPSVCCAGSAGAEVPAGRKRLEKLLMRLLPGCRIAVVHDTRLILAAARLESGIALIAGTGSVAYGRDAGGREARVGGWGWLLGDEGGAVWLAREAAREVMRRADAGEPSGRLGEAMFGAVRARGASELTGRLHRFREPRSWADLAHVVFETAGDDPGAGALIELAAEALTALVNRVRERLSFEGPVVLAGGLLLNHARLESAVRLRLGSIVVRLEEPPVAGAVRLAELNAA